jgi:hypothetical protein
MPLTPFDKFLPWTGAAAGVIWGVWTLVTVTVDDPSDPHAAAMLADGFARNLGTGIALQVGALLLLFFAAAVRRALRTGEAGEATYSSVAYAGAVAAAVAMAFLSILQLALAGAAHDGDTAAVNPLAHLALVGWRPVLVGVAALLWGTGLGGLRNAALPRWFAVPTMVLAVISVLGPIAIIIYLVLPVWLIGASVAVSSQQAKHAPAQVPARA